VTITGSNFGATQGTSTVIFNGTNATPTAWSATSVTVPVPASATTGNVIVTVNGVSSNGVIFTPSVSLGTPLSIDVTPANTSVSAGTTQQFTATAHYSDGGSQDVTLSASWISSSLSVAVLDVAGTATATAYGQASIQASSGSVTGAALLSVSPGDLNPVITPAYQFVQGTSASYNQKTIDVGNDGFGRFVVGDSSCNGPSDQIVYVRCLDQDCTSSHTTRITTGNWTLDYSMAVGPDGFARIAYSTFSNIPFTDQKYSGFLGFIQCSDDDCSSYSNIPIAGTSDEGVSSIAVRNDGTAFIVFDDGNDFDGPQGVGLATCTNGCSATHIADVNVRATIAGALALDLNGNPTIVYLSDDQFVHYVSSTGVDTIVSSDSSGWGNIEITTAPDGFTRIAFINSTGNAVNYIKCSDLNCGSSVITTIQIPGMSHGVVSMGIGSDGFVRLQVGLSTPYPGSMQFVTCRNSDCSDYNLEKIQGSWDMTKDVISLVAKLNQAPIMLAQSPDGSVKELRAKVPTSAKILENTLTTYSNQTWSSCDGKESKSNQYGYYRCVFYQIQDQSTPPQDVEKILAVNEVVTPVARNVIADIVTAPSATNPAGQFQDGLGFLYSTPLPNGFCTYAKQTLYATDNEKPIRVNCLHYLQSDLDIVDVTSDTSQCAAPTVKCDPLPDAVITGLSPNTGNEGTMVTINGRNFGAAAGQSYVTFNGVAATRPTWTDTQITVAVPSGATTGNVVVKTPFTTGNGMLFTVPPNITGLSPASGAVGTSVLITGKNFGSTASNGSVTFNGATAIPGTWTDTVISVTVPSGATNGNVVVTVNGAPSNGLPFTIVPN